MQNILVWDKLVPRFKPTRFLEVGSYEGRSTCYLIEKFAPTEPVEIHCIDTWEGGIEHDKAEACRRSRALRQQYPRRHGKNRQSRDRESEAQNVLTPGARPPARGRCETQPFDLVYVDGSHQAPAVLADAVLVTSTCCARAG